MSECYSAFTIMHRVIVSGLHFTGITVALLPVEDILVGSGDKRVKNYTN